MKMRMIDFHFHFGWIDGQLRMDGWSRRRPQTPPPCLATSLMPEGVAQLVAMHSAICTLPFVLCHLHVAISPWKGARIPQKRLETIV